MDSELLSISAETYSDLGYLQDINDDVINYLVGEVCRNVVNDTLSIQYSQNLDIIDRLSRDLENENVVLSNSKIHKIVLALRTVIKVYYKVYTKLAASNEDPSTDLNERINYQLSIRTSLQPDTCQTILKSINAMIKQ